MTLTIGPRTLIWLGVFIIYFLNLLRFDSTKTGGGSYFPATSHRDNVAVVTFPIAVIMGLVGHLVYMEFFK